MVVYKEQGMVVYKEQGMVMYKEQGKVVDKEHGMVMYKEGAGYGGVCNSTNNLFYSLRALLINNTTPFNTHIKT